MQRNVAPRAASLVLCVRNRGISCRGRCGIGRAPVLCLSASDVDLLGDLDSVIDLDTEVAHSAFDLQMAEQKLDRAQIPSAAIG